MTTLERCAGARTSRRGSRWGTWVAADESCMAHKVLLMDWSFGGVGWPQMQVMCTGPHRVMHTYDCPEH
jgi:hypothetical protein